MQNPAIGILYLIPNFISESNDIGHLAPQVTGILKNLDYFIGESEKSLRALVKKAVPEKAQSELKIAILNEHNASESPEILIDPLLKGYDMGLCSDAGMPCIADPGYQLVRLCHQKNITVVPLAGASSILLTLAGSGFNGQQFTFHGYLPYEKNERHKKIKLMELEAQSKSYTQLFMEAPYRNNQLLKELITLCRPKTFLCAGIALTSPEEKIITQTIAEWKNSGIDLHKKPVMFGIGK